jgi:hypothetical protein
MELSVSTNVSVTEETLVSGNSVVKFFRVLVSGTSDVVTSFVFSAVTVSKEVVGIFPTLIKSVLGVAVDATADASVLASSFIMFVEATVLTLAISVT